MPLFGLPNAEYQPRQEVLAVFWLAVGDISFNAKSL